MFEAIEFGPFIIWTHLLFLMLAFLFASEFFFRLAQSANLSIQHFRDHAKWYLLGILLGGRVFAVIAEYRAYLKWEEPFRFLKIHDGNFSFLGAAFGVAVVLYLMQRTSRTTFLQWLDVLLPAMTFGLSFDWLGKFAGGQAYGRPTDMFWGITYDAINVRFAVPIHPVQLYYALFYFVLTFLLLIVRRHSLRAGAETLVGIILASLMTFFLEFFRGDFGIPVFATRLDFLFLFILFASLGFFTMMELKLAQRTVLVIEGIATMLCVAYFFSRSLLPFDAYELRFSQLLSVLALLGTVVYVVVHRSRHPHL